MNPTKREGFREADRQLWPACVIPTRPPEVDARYKLLRLNRDTLIWPRTWMVRTPC